jgi:hypothetical protein
MSRLHGRPYVSNSNPHYVDFDEILYKCHVTVEDCVEFTVLRCVRIAVAKSNYRCQFARRALFPPEGIL